MYQPWPVVCVCVRVCPTEGYGTPLVAVHMNVSSVTRPLLYYSSGSYPQTDAPPAVERPVMRQFLSFWQIMHFLLRVCPAFHSLSVSQVSTSGLF